MEPYRRLDLGLLRAVLLTPNDPLPRLLAADWFGEQGDDEAAEIIRAGRVPVDDMTGNAAWQLNRVTMLPGSWDKRFVKDVTSPVANWWAGQTADSHYGIRPTGHGLLILADAEHRLTPKQYLWTWRLLRRYRRQWAGKGKPALLKHAELILAMPVRG